ncbi:hypothetical protein [Allosphingosinicella sp.]|uniref:hypothetical protein n=1 Tax=Allosphingosinicella sp. TaxID=2823234 RepID=UPI002FC18D6F
MMDTTVSNHQGRARGLYDEQLQRQKQEKLLFRQSVSARSRAVVLVKDDEPSL